MTGESAGVLPGIGEGPAAWFGYVACPAALCGRIAFGRGPTVLSAGWTVLSVGWTVLSIGRAALSIGRAALSIGRAALSRGRAARDPVARFLRVPSRIRG